MPNKPIKRNEHIAPLSREHHFSLLFCWKIRQGIRSDVATTRINKYVQHFWEGHIQPHFKEEESLLFIDLTDPLVRQALNEHSDIKEQIRQLQQAGINATIEQFTFLADRIESHIRFEERTLFPHLERGFSMSQLENIGNQLKIADAVPLKDNYPDEFWLKSTSSL